MFDKSYVKSTGQLWKFCLFFIAFPLIGLALIWIVLRGMVGEEVNVCIFLVLFGLGLSVVGFVVGVLTIQCPKCKARLLWKAVREQSHQNWFGWFIGLTKCPVCQNTVVDS